MADMEVFRSVALAAAAAAALSACGSRENQGPADVYEEQADALDNAAEVSEPAAQPVLENAADDLRTKAEQVERTGEVPAQQPAEDGEEEEEIVGM
jgi:ABC-type uncharacterized transport system auxiliary subunit